MRQWSKSFVAIFTCAVAVSFGGAAASAQTITGSATIALKSGETTEVGNVYFVSNCKSLLKATPDVEILDGPPGVTASIKEGMVMPRIQNCAKPVQGGTLMLAAKDIEDPSYTNLTVRVTYKTKDGIRRFSQVYNLSLLP